MSKILVFDEDARKKIRDGVHQLAKAVKITLGPTGRNVIIKRQDGSLLITKDGVTVAKEMELKDPFENVGAQLVKEVASRTSDVAGDGTTTATVLAEAIFEAGAKQLAVGADAMSLKRGIDLATKAAIEALQKLSKPIANKEQVAQVGMISANNDKEIGDLLADVMAKVGNDGVVTVEEAKGKGLDTVTELVEGMQFDRGYMHSVFQTNLEKEEASWDHPLIVLWDGRINSVKELVGFLEKAIPTEKAIVLIPEDIEGDALVTLSINRARLGLKILAIKAPGFGDNRKDMMQDIAIVTGGRVFSKALGDALENIDMSQAGQAKRVTSTKDKTVIIDGAGKSEDIKQRISSLQNQLEEADNSGDYQRNILRDRLGKLSGGVAMVYVGAASEIEMKEKKARIEDALHATRAAIEEGVVPGGGVALLRCIKAVQDVTASLTDEDEASGSRIIEKALLAPLTQISKNAGQSDAIVEKVLASVGNMGYNARTNKFEDLMIAGVIDPTKVVRTALLNSASVAGLMLTTDAILVEEPKEEKKPVNSMMPGMMG